MREPHISRRAFVAGAAGAGAAAATSRAPSSLRPVKTAQAIAPAVAFGVAAGGVAVGYLMNEGVDYFLGDERDYSGYTGGDALHQEIVVGATEMKSADERVMTSIGNNITNSDNVALAKGKAAIIEEMNAGNDESAAQTAMQEAIDGYFATIQKNLIEHHNAQVNQVQHHIQRFQEHVDVNPSGTFYLDGYNSNASGPDDAYYTNESWDGSFTADQSTDVDLLNGETKTVEYFDVKPTGYTDPFPVIGYPWNPDSYAQAVRVSDPDSGDNIRYFQPMNYSVWEDVKSQRDSVNSNLSGFVTDVYSQYEPGDIPTEDLVDPITASTELAQNYDHYATQGAHAAMLGIPTSAEQSVHVTLEDDGEEVWCDIYTEYVPTDTDGNAVGFQSGETYSPQNWDAPLYIAFEYVDPNTEETISDFTQIEQDFTINVVEDADGNEVDQFQTENRNNQTADVSALQEELDQLREEQLRLQEEAQEGGGGGWNLDDFSLGAVPGAAVVTGAAVTVAGIVGYGMTSD